MDLEAAYWATIQNINIENLDRMISSKSGFHIIGLVICLALSSISCGPLRIMIPRESPKEVTLTSIDEFDIYAFTIIKKDSDLTDGRVNSFKTLAVNYDLQQDDAIREEIYIFLGKNTKDGYYIQTRPSARGAEKGRLHNIFIDKNLNLREIQYVYQCKILKDKLIFYNMNGENNERTFQIIRNSSHDSFEITKVKIEDDDSTSWTDPKEVFSTPIIFQNVATAFAQSRNIIYVTGGSYDTVKRYPQILNIGFSKSRKDFIIQLDKLHKPFRIFRGRLNPDAS